MPSTPSYLLTLKNFLSTHFPNDDAHWNYSENNTVPSNWLYATPTKVWGLPYTQFKQAVPGDSTDFNLQACTTSAGPTQQCQIVSASVTDPEQTPAHLLVGQSYEIYDSIYEVMTSARVLLDITTLTIPTGAFMTAFTNAITYLSHLPENQRPVIRILYSNPLPNIPPLRADPFLSEITKQLDPAKKMTIYVTVMSSSFSSWNHAKIVVADGQTALVGGHNMWGSHYLGKNPVADVSMKLSGRAALHAQTYANSLWDYELVRKKYQAVLGVAEEMFLHASYVYDSQSQKCKIKYDSYPPQNLYSDEIKKFPDQPTTKGVSVISVGRGANTRHSYLLPTILSYLFPFNEASDEVILKAISLATSSIRMSLQAFRLIPNNIPIIQTYLLWNNNLIEAMAKALQRGVDMKIVLSNPDAVAGGLGPTVAPYFGDEPSTVNMKMHLILTKSLGLSSADADNLISTRFHVASYRFSSDKTFPNNTPIANHAKTFIIDEKLFYIGSQNLYPSNLNEFGYIVEDETTATRYMQQYWTPLWNFSSVTCTTYQDEDVATAEKVEAIMFIADLNYNALSNMIWLELKSQLDKQTDPAIKNKILAKMNDHIVNTGFQTQVSFVLEALENPFFSENPPSTKPTSEALRFVANLMASPALMKSFSAVIEEKTSTVDKANDNINLFLINNGYNCTALEILSAFNAMQKKVLQYWVGNYETWITDDGGSSYTLPDNSSASTLFSSQLNASDNETIPQTISGLSIAMDGSIKLGDETIQNPIYNNNSLKWEKSDGSTGNKTSASLQFGHVSRATLNDNFLGNEVFGTITYPQHGSTNFKGTYSIYGRLPQVPPSKPDPDNKGWPTAYWILGIIGLAAFLGVLGFFVWRAYQRQNRYAEYRRIQREKDAINEFAEDNSISVTSQNRKIEMEVLSGSQLSRRAVAQQDSVEEMARYETQMNQSQRIELAQSSTRLKTAQQRLSDPSAEDISKTVEMELQETEAIQRNLDAISTSLEEIFSKGTQAALHDNAQISEQAVKNIDKFRQDQEEDRPFEEEVFNK